MRRTQLTIRLRLLCHKRACVYRWTPLARGLVKRSRRYRTISTKSNFTILKSIKDVTITLTYLVYEKDISLFSFLVLRL